MEEGTQVNPGEVRVKSLDTKIEELKKEDDEETALENEFIKVEKESIDLKENSLIGKSTTVVEDLSCSPEVKSSNKEPNSELLESHEKIKQLETELGTLSQELQYAESEKARFQAEVSIANEKLQQSDKRYEEVEIDLRRLKEEMVEAGLKHQSQLESLREAFTDQEAKHKELLSVKEAFDALSLELESSRKKAEKLELELVSSADELRKFEELSNERGLHADSESKKALELEKILEIAKLNAKEMEKQMGLLQEELKGLYDKVTQSQHAEEALSKTRFDLSVLHEELELSKLQVAELSQKVVSEEAVTQELTQELNLHKASEEQLREDIIAMETTLSASKENIQTKDANINELELKLLENLEEKGKFEANLKIQELQVLSLQEELLRSSKEKETLEMTIGELDGYLLQSKERCGELENKLNLSEENFIKTDILLSETLSLNTELQQNLKSLEELQKESGAVAEMLSQKNIEFEDMLRASNAALDDVKAQLKETEARLISVEQTNIELDQQLNLAELKCGDSDREIKELHDKVSELSNLVKSSEEEHAISKCHFQAYQDRVSQLESSLEKSSSRKAELEKELAEKCAEHESHSTAARDRSLELEELIQVAHSKVEHSGKRASELDLLLETTNHRILELEEQLNIKELKHKDTEAELKQKNNQLSELSAELEAFQVKSSSLEVALDAANNKERELADLLNAVSEEKKKFEDLSKNSGEKLLEAENLVDVLQTELNSNKEKLQNVVSDLEVSGIREREILEQLKSAQEQLEHQGRAVENATARSLELESLHDSLSKESELKLQEANVSFTQKDSEAKQLQEKLKSFEEQAAHYQNEATEATNRLALLEIELKENANRLVSLESIINELKTKLLDAENRSEQSFSENELLAETNMKLKAELEAHQHKINDLHGSLSSVHVEKDATAEQLAFHVQTIAELRGHHSKALELHSETELRKKETEAQLTEAFERLTQKDTEARGLTDRINDLENLVNSYEERLREAAVATEVQTAELDESLSKLRILDGIVEEAKSKISQLESENECLAEANMKLTQELATNETQMNDLQTTINTILSEKENACGELHLLSKTNEALAHKLTSEGEILQSQISSLVEEKNLVDQKHQETRNEMQAVIIQMEEQINEYRAKEHSLNEQVESLIAELKVKSEMQEQIAELKQKLLSSEIQFTEEIESIKVASAEKEAALISRLEEHASKLKDKDILCEQLEQLQKELNLAHTAISEQKEADSRKDLEQEAAIKQLLGEMEAKHQHAIALEKQVEEFKQELHESEVQLAEKDKEESERLKSELDELRIKLSQSAEEIAELKNNLQLAYKSEQYKGDNAESRAKDEVQVKSRDFDFSALKGQGSHTSTEAVAANPEATTTTETTGLMALKFILGVALVSMIIGVILGKRY